VGGRQIGSSNREQRDKGIMARRVVPSVEVGVDEVSSRVLSEVSKGVDGSRRRNDFVCRIGS
jgi:hypothetical protein